MKRYYKIYITKKQTSTREIIKGYYHGKNVRATKLYKELYDDTFYKDMYHSIGTEEIRRVEYLKGTQPSIYKSLHPKQKEFLQSLKTAMDDNIINLPYTDVELVTGLVNEDKYNIHDSEDLNNLLNHCKKTFL